MLEISNDLGQAEHPHGDDDKADAVSQLREPEAVTRDAGIDIGAGQPKHETDDDHGDGVQQRAARQHDRGNQAERHQREVFGRTEPQRDIGQRWREQGDQHRGSRSRDE